MATDILWVGYPNSYTAGRRMRIMGVCLHYTAGSEGPTSAEAGARYDKTRVDGTSCHLFTDSAGPALREVPDGDRAHTARAHGNEIFIHIEICGTLQTRTQWLDAVSYATLRTTAGVVAQLVQRHGLQVRRMTDAEVRTAYYDNANPNAVRGICEHANCTRAFPEDQGDHLDVGPGFPWDVFLAMVHDELAPPIEEEYDVYYVIETGMPKTPDNPNGERVIASTGVHWWWVRDFGPLAARGVAFPSQRVTSQQLRDAFGIEATAGGPATLVPHDHEVPAGSTGPAVPA